MNLKFSKKDVDLELIFNLSSYFLVFSFALFPFISSISFTIFICVCLLMLFQRKTFDFNKKHFKVLLLSTPIFIYLLGVLYSPNLNEAINLVMRVVPIIILPILFCFKVIETRILDLNLRKYYVFGVIFSVIISLSFSLITYLVNGDFNVFFYYELCSFLHLHPTYYSLYILIALFFLLSDTHKGQGKVLRIIISFLFVIFLFLLQVKIAFITFTFLFLIILIIKKNRLLHIVVFIIPLVLIYFLGNIHNSFIKVCLFFESL